MMGAIEFLYCFFSAYLSPEVLIIAGSLFVSLIVSIHNGVDGIMIVYFLPLLVASSYYNGKLIILSGFTNIIFFLLLYIMNEDLRVRIDVFEFIVILSGIVIGVVLCHLIMNRGIEVIGALEKTDEDRKNLLVENVIMDRQTKVDMLTGLYNQKTFHSYLEELLAQSHVYSIPIQLAVLDIDDFKYVNDTYGHWAGDQILRKIAITIQKFVDGNDFVSRYGGEEFAVIFIEKAFEQSLEIVEKIRKNIEIQQHPEIDNGTITVSIGLQNYHCEWKREEFFNKADQLLYKAKRNGKNQTVAEQ